MSRKRDFKSQISDFRLRELSFDGLTAGKRVGADEIGFVLSGSARLFIS